MHVSADQFGMRSLRSLRKYPQGGGSDVVVQFTTRHLPTSIAATYLEETVAAPVDRRQTEAKTGEVCSLHARRRDIVLILVRGRLGVWGGYVC